MSPTSEPVEDARVARLHEVELALGVAELATPGRLVDRRDREDRPELAHVEPGRLLAGRSADHAFDELHRFGLLVRRRGARLDQQILDELALELVADLHLVEVPDGLVGAEGDLLPARVHERHVARGVVDGHDPRLELADGRLLARRARPLTRRGAAGEDQEANEGE